MSAVGLEALRALLVRHFRGEDSDSIDVVELRRAADLAAKGLEKEALAKLESWRSAVAHFGQLEDDVKAVEVARGLRLCRVLAGAPKVARTKRPEPTSPLTQGTDSLPGIGPVAASALAERGIECVGDLIYLVPRRYDDARSAVSLADLKASEAGERVTVAASVESRALVRRGRRRWLDVRFHEEDARLIVRFFGAYPSALDRFAVGTAVTVAGALSVRGGAYEMSNPDVLAVGSDDAMTAAQILPRYTSIPGVPGKRLAKACAVALERAGAQIQSAVPSWVESELELDVIGEALAKLHAPPGDGGLELATKLNERTTPWHRRLAFEEMFVLAAQISRRRESRRSGEAFACRLGDLTATAGASLPFELTGAQMRVGEEITADLAQTVPMNRLLQGDVGCGKTAVAFLAAATAIGAGAQVALMAPTEILAEQHAASLGRLAESTGIRLSLLTGSLQAAQKRSLLALLGAGKIDLVVGTHALLSESVEFAKLGLVIVDEQHRFGVAQRVALRRKGLAPHLLVMTATPIPRSLALSVYGDLDVSVIDELPPGRSPTETHVMRGDRGRVSTYQALRRRVERGEQAYVVCPLVEPADEDIGRPWRSAIEVHAELGAALDSVSVGLVHGRLATDDRTRAMNRFREGTDRVLVATTVIEVGVDVPSATVMVIEDANHFGLAQLHQLRGRVGRGTNAGHCALLCRGRLTDDASRRLAVMEETADGFQIAEEDLAIRGPGELLGARQAGLPLMRFGDLTRHPRSVGDRASLCEPDYRERPRAREGRARLPSPGARSDRASRRGLRRRGRLGRS